jgi:lipid-A-disaccharide synthase
MKIAIVAGELSGDTLGAGLIAALREHYPEACFEGIGGERMLAQGLTSLFPLEELAVMGLVEVLARLPVLLRIRRGLEQRFTARPPAVFIGIDAPDFNLPLERQLRAGGIPTVHYVSPQVWAWRQRRVRKIAHAVDLMLTLLPFEVAFYQDHQVPVRYVGHPLADAIPLQCDRLAARAALGLPVAGTRLALLPGSRLSEVRRLGPLFVEVAGWLHNRRPELSFIIPAATDRIHAYLAAWLASRAPHLPVRLMAGRARTVLAAADGVLVASGTATLETALLKRPMVVAYQVAPSSAWLARRLLTVSRFALPNLLAGKDLVPEFIQEAATVEKLGTAMLAWLDDPPARARLEQEFTALHQLLRCDASRQAAAAIAELLQQRLAKQTTEGSVTRSSE